MSCGICLEAFNDPVCCGCGHVFCHGCLVRYVRGNRIHDPILCPICRAQLGHIRIIPPVAQSAIKFHGVHKIFISSTEQDDLRSKCDGLETRNTELARRNAELEKRNKELQKRVERRDAQLNKTHGQLLTTKLQNIPIVKQLLEPPEFLWSPPIGPLPSRPGHASSQPSATAISHQPFPNQPIESNQYASETGGSGAWRPRRSADLRRPVEHGGPQLLLSHRMDRDSYHRSIVAAFQR